MNNSLYKSFKLKELIDENISIEALNLAIYKIENLIRRTL